MFSPYPLYDHSFPLYRHRSSLSLIHISPLSHSFHLSLLPLSTLSLSPPYNPLSPLNYHSTTPLSPHLSPLSLLSMTTLSHLSYPYLDTLSLLPLSPLLSLATLQPLSPLYDHSIPPLPSISSPLLLFLPLFRPHSGHFLLSHFPLITWTLSLLCIVWKLLTSNGQLSG